jgi:hypothetical protein
MSNTGTAVAKKVGVKIASKQVVKIIGKGVTAINPAQCVNEISTAYTEYRQIQTQETTKRRQIEAWEKVSLKKIKAQRDLLMEYLDRSFDERKENFSNLFKMLDKAAENGDTQSIAIALKSIVDLASNGPFKDIASVDAVRGVLSDPNQDFEF